MPNDKLPPKSVAEPTSELPSSTSGEFPRRAADDNGTEFRSHSVTRRALPARGRRDEEVRARRPKAKGSAAEQTLRSAKLPKRIRMSLRMRRVAATAVTDTATVLRPGERICLRMAGRAVELPMDRELLAGRAPDCDLLIDDRRCSRQHAVFSRTPDGGALVRDLGSTNGTYVNGVRISTEQRLMRGDWTTIGNETLELCDLPSAPEPQTPTIPAGPRREQSAEAAARSGCKTEPGSPMLSAASLAATAANRAAAEARASAARKPLAALLRRIERGQTIREGDAEIAGMVALNLCRATSDPEWLDYLFRLYTALCLPLPEPLLERLSETLPLVQLDAATTLSPYLAALDRAPDGSWSDAQQQLIAKLLELQARYARERAQ